ncbi:MAG: cytochrome c oxidase subunit II [Deltaproteobacteria bacterium]|nr:cytochrome c oxidase subunit II [Deltaproteobacteria bacterium]
MSGTPNSFWLPEAASTTAAQHDAGWSLVLWISAFFFVLVVGLMSYFVIRYRRRSETEIPDAPDHNTRLEIVWTLIPVAIVVVLFAVGFKGFLKGTIAPADSMEIFVTAERWMWTFTYPNGATSVNELRVPLGRPVKLVMSSKDVIHSFYVPEFRLKKDVVPNSYTTAWFEPTQVGEMTVTCTEYCGAGHSAMLAKLQVMPEKEFRDWLDAGGEEKGVSPEKAGEKLAMKLACATCHSTDGSAKTGPTWKGLYNHPTELADGTTVTADENYLRESITDPNKKVVKGFQPVMPAFKGLVTQKQLDALIAYLKSLK